MFASEELFLEFLFDNPDPMLGRSLTLLAPLRALKDPLSPPSGPGSIAFRLRGSSLIPEFVVLVSSPLARPQRRARNAHVALPLVSVSQNPPFLCFALRLDAFLKERGGCFSRFLIGVPEFSRSASTTAAGWLPCPRSCGKDRAGPTAGRRRRGRRCPGPAQPARGVFPCDVLALSFPRAPSRRRTSQVAGRALLCRFLALVIARDATGPGRRPRRLTAPRRPGDIRSQEKPGSPETSACGRPSFPGNLWPGYF